MKNKKRTDYLLILDRSSSMTDCINETLKGYYNQLRQLRALAIKFENQEIFASLILFDSRVSLVYQSLNVLEIPKLVDLKFNPSGSTSLYDAIGISIFAHKNIIDENPKERTVVVSVITDGLENSSRYFNISMLSWFVNKSIEENKWEFIFIGTSKDIMKQADMIGIPSSNQFCYTKEQIIEAFQFTTDYLHNRIISKEVNKENIIIY